MPSEPIRNGARTKEFERAKWRARVKIRDGKGDMAGASQPELSGPDRRERRVRLS